MSSDWRRMKLGDVINLKRGFDLPAKERKPGNIPIITSSGISDYHIEAKVKGPGVATGRYGTIGSVYFCQQDYWPHNTTLFVEDFKGNDPRFVYYLLHTIRYSDYTDKAAVPGVNRNHLHTSEVLLPDLASQQEIARVLTSLDDKIELNCRMNATLEAMAQALFQSWFVAFDPVKAKAAGRAPEGMDADTAALFPSELVESELGLIPKGWEVGSILTQAKLLSGGTPKTERPDYWNGNVLWASAKDVSQANQTFLIETERTITAKGLAESATQLIPALGTVIVARGATTGRMVLFGKEIAMNQTCYALVSSIGTPLALHCQLRRTIDALVHAAHGSVFNTITTSTFSTSKIMLPSAETLQAFEQVASPIFQKILTTTEECLSLATLRDTLLPKLISGQLRIPDAEAMAEAGL